MPEGPEVETEKLHETIKESNVESSAISRTTLARALSLSSWKAIWQTILWPRSPHDRPNLLSVPFTPPKKPSARAARV